MKEKKYNPVIIILICIGTNLFVASHFLGIISRLLDMIEYANEMFPTLNINVDVIFFGFKASSLISVLVDICFFVSIVCILTACYIYLNESI